MGWPYICWRLYQTLLLLFCHFLRRVCGDSIFCNSCTWFRACVITNLWWRFLRSRSASSCIVSIKWEAASRGFHLMRIICFSAWFNTCIGNVSSSDLFCWSSRCFWLFVGNLALFYKLKSGLSIYKLFLKIVLTILETCNFDLGLLSVGKVRIFVYFLISRWWFSEIRIEFVVVLWRDDSL